jgi:hypothetical protein
MTVVGISFTEVDLCPIAKVGDRAENTALYPGI